MKLPFLNRRRYLVVKAYTSSKRALDDVPLCLTKDVSQDHLNSERIPPTQRKYIPTFNTCYGRLAALRNSITLRTWCEFEITTTKDTCKFDWPNGNGFMNANNMEDAAFKPSGLRVIKICPPWMLESNDNSLEVLHCSHILNTSHLHIASGIIPMRTDPTLNFFTYLPKRNDTYSIPYKMPIIQMFPLTDLPIQIECSYNLDKYTELHTMTSSNPYFSGGISKCMKNENTTV